VALAAIQALAAELERLREENARLAERMHDLEQP
jgi:cell division protein FtsB